ncbi:adenosylmethionine decarboxylase [Oceanobacillus chungangensis]|uniref:S-adenosylmethionine decarboxylase proenzyme n=1 Tax=Oceanobacillus chungangensis TaxID=1229152 RepID=A0A3D8PPY4_9BACI|nr:adenosylmethionine decarboxylase [Oceanobacillus chungangensis]RDW17259.1 S-adenosylmethionine decarboxylase proenzyme [Oceanobacillus chungangensis]
MNLKNRALGRHVLIDYYGCTTEIIENNGLIEQYMQEAADYAGARVVESVFHHFNPYGVSGAVIIAESHLTIHTWPEYDFASVDVFTCGDEVDPKKAADYLTIKLQAKKTELTELPRGIAKNIKQFANQRDKDKQEKMEMEKSEG